MISKIIFTSKELIRLKVKHGRQILFSVLLVDSFVVGVSVIIINKIFFFEFLSVEFIANTFLQQTVNTTFENCKMHNLLLLFVLALPPRGPNLKPFGVSTLTDAALDVAGNIGSTKIRFRTIALVIRQLLCF